MLGGLGVPFGVVTRRRGTSTSESARFVLSRPVRSHFGSRPPQHLHQDHRLLPLSACRSHQALRIPVCFASFACVPFSGSHPSVEQLPLTSGPSGGRSFGGPSLPPPPTAIPLSASVRGPHGTGHVHWASVARGTWYAMAGDESKSVTTTERDPSRSPPGKPAEAPPTVVHSIELEAGRLQTHHPPQSGMPSAVDHLATSAAQLSLLPAIHVGQAQLAARGVGEQKAAIAALSLQLSARAGRRSQQRQCEFLRRRRDDQAACEARSFFGPQGEVSLVIACVRGASARHSC